MNDTASINYDDVTTETDEFNRPLYDPDKLPRKSTEEVLFDISSYRKATWIEEPSIRAPRNILPPKSSKNLDSFKLLQLWEGYVSDINGDEFTATVCDRTNPDYPNEEVVFSIEEVTPDDRELLQKGAVFYWSIGYADSIGKPRSRESRIRFRRIPGWTQREIDSSRNKAKELAQLFAAD